MAWTFDPLSAIGSIVGASAANKNAKIQAKMAKYNTDQTILANRKMAEYEFSKNLQMWNMGNQYNSPEAQQERLKKANLNPNLVYGNGAVGNSSGTLPQYHAPTQSYNYKPGSDPVGVIEQFQDVGIKKAQVDNLKEQHKSMELDNLQKILNLGINREFQRDLTSSKAITAYNKMLGSQVDQNKKVIDFAIGYDSDPYGTTHYPQNTQAALRYNTETQNKIAELGKTQLDLVLGRQRSDLLSWELGWKKMFGPAWSTLGSLGLGAAKLFIPGGKAAGMAGKAAKGVKPVVQNLPNKLKKILIYD